MLHVYIFVILYCKALAENWFWFHLHLDLIQHLKRVLLGYVAFADSTRKKANFS